MLGMGAPPADVAARRAALVGAVEPAFSNWIEAASA
jgi:hypothetical protein